MSNKVIEEIQRLIPSNAKRNSHGWYQWNCPACNDRRSRFNLLLTDTGGFRTHCFNGGCDYHKSGWEPDSAFSGRPRHLFVLMGGSISDIPSWMLKPQHHIIRDPTAELEVVKDFPDILLPDGVQLLWQEALNNNMQDCQSYVLRRGSLFVEYPFLWSPKYPRHAIYPFEYHSKIVGWIARAVDEENKFRHIKCPNFPTNYMLHQDYAFRNGMVIVQEGVFDAIALNSLCTFGSTISKKQTNLLKQVKDSGRQVILLPDHQGNEWTPYWNIAKDNGFLLSIPDYPNNTDKHIKDVGDSIRQNGPLLTVEAIVESIIDNYTNAYVKLQDKSRS